MTNYVFEIRKLCIYMHFVFFMYLYIFFNLVCLRGIRYNGISVIQNGLQFHLISYHFFNYILALQILELEWTPLQI